jgi:hypothetical protein
VVEHLPSKCEALSSNPSIVRKKKKKTRAMSGNNLTLEKGFTTGPFLKNLILKQLLFLLWDSILVGLVWLTFS